MNSLEISHFIADTIKESSIGISAKVHPVAVFAPSAYHSIEADGVVLIYHDMVKGYNHPEIVMSGKHVGIMSRISRFVVSVGVKSSTDSLDIDSKCERIEEILAYKRIDENQELIPVSWSRITQDSNDTFWRQMWFEATTDRSI